MSVYSSPARPPSKKLNLRYLRVVARLYWKIATIRLWRFGRSARYIRFIVLATPRTGSTLLHTYLNDHMRVLSMGERVQRSSFEFEWPLMPANIQAVGFKFFYQNTDESIWSSEQQRLSIGRDVKIIWLRRRNTLRQWVSLKISENSGQWTSDARAAAVKALRLNVPEFLSFANDLQAKDRWMQSELKAKKHMMLYYEDLVAHHNKLRLVWEFLGVRPANVITLLEKQNDWPLHELIADFDQFAAELPEAYKKMLGDTSD